MESMQALHVSVRSVDTVFPASSCQSQILLLNPVDQWMQWIPYHKRILFFNTQNDMTAISPFDLVDTLKASLSETLAHFPPFAGRIRMRDDDGRMEVVCNGDGAQFIEATAHAKLPDMNEFQPSPIFSPLAQTPGYDLRFPWKPDYPLLFVQVTSFEEGGFSVGVSFSHQIADGSSFWQFMRSWGEIARGLPISSHPQFNYGSLHHPPPSAGSKSENSTPRSLYKLVDAKQPLIFESSDVASRLFHFSPKALSDLKLLGGESSNGRPFTTFEVVCAHIWQRGTIARELEEDQETKLMIAANLRGRHSSYPPNYFGNGAIFTAAITTAGDLKAASLGDVANIIQKAISDFREEEMNDLLGFLHETSFQFKEKRPGFRMDRARDMVIRSSPRLRMYETDFGWGRPTSVTFDVEGNHEGAVLFDGGRDEGSLDITLSLPPKVMGRLLNNQAFFPNKR